MAQVDASRMAYLRNVSSGNLPKVTQKRVIALHVHEAEDDAELSFKEGEVIVVTDDEDAGWWVGYVESKGPNSKNGQFPANYVKLHQVQVEEKPKPKSKKKHKNKHSKKNPTSAASATATDATKSNQSTDVYGDIMRPLPLTASEQVCFDQAMMRLRGRNVSKEIQEMLRMLDREKRGVITTMLFKTTMMGSKWHLTMSETGTITKYLAGDARIVDYNQFAALIEEKLQSKEEDEKVRLDRHLKLFRRVSVTSANVDTNQIRKRWSAMNLMAEKSKINQKRRAVELEEKRAILSKSEQQKKKVEMERTRQRRERLALSHMSYRDQSKLATAKYKKLKKEEQFRKFQDLKKANQVQFSKNTNSTGSDGEELGELGRELLFDGKIVNMRPLSKQKQKPFAGDVFTGSLNHALTRGKASLMSRSEFETWEKHINGEGKVFFHNPVNKKSTWALPPCAILVDCTGDEVVGGGVFEEPTKHNSSRRNHTMDDDATGPEDMDIFLSHPAWDQREMPVFNELKRIGIRSLSPTEQEWAHEMDTERILDEQMTQKGVYTRTINYHDLKPGMLQPTKPIGNQYYNANNKNKNSNKVSPRKARNMQQQTGKRRKGKRREKNTSQRTTTNEKRQQLTVKRQGNTEKMNQLNAAQQQSLMANEKNIERRMTLEKQASHKKLEERRLASKKKKSSGKKEAATTKEPEPEPPAVAVELTAAEKRLKKKKELAERRKKKTAVVEEEKKGEDAATLEEPPAGGADDNDGTNARLEKRKLLTEKRLQKKKMLAEKRRHKNDATEAANLAAEFGGDSDE